MDVFGTPGFLKIAKKSAVLITGRFYTIQARDLKNGNLIWDIKKSNPKIKFKEMNFNTPLILKDRNGDETKEILSIQGGNNKDQYIPGKIFLISGNNGKVLKEINVPSKKEIYSVPALDAKNNQIILASGGETLAGHIFSLNLKNFKVNWKFPSKSKGFVASPIVIKFGKDRFDSINASYEGKVYRLNHKGKKQWIFDAGNKWEIASTPGIGHFNNDSIPDVVAFFSKGKWPNYSEAKGVWINGKNSNIIREVKLGTMIYGSPINHDFNNDGYDETIIMVNYKMDFSMDAPSRLMVFDGKSGLLIFEKKQKGFSAITPILKDMDRNGKLDLIFGYRDWLERIEFKNINKVPLKWNQFRGINFNGVYNEN